MSFLTKTNDMLYNRQMENSRHKNFDPNSLDLIKGKLLREEREAQEERETLNQVKIRLHHKLPKGVINVSSDNFGNISLYSNEPLERVTEEEPQQNKTIESLTNHPEIVNQFLDKDLAETQKTSQNEKADEKKDSDVIMKNTMNKETPKPNPARKKEREVRDIRDGDTLEVIGNNKKTIYKIISNKDGKVNYRNEKGASGSMGTEDMKKFLLDPKVSFSFVTTKKEPKIFNTKKVTSITKSADKKNITKEPEPLIANTENNKETTDILDDNSIVEKEKAKRLEEIKQLLANYTITEDKEEENKILENLKKYIIPYGLELGITKEELLAIGVPENLIDNEENGKEDEIAELMKQATEFIKNQKEAEEVLEKLILERNELQKQLDEEILKDKEEDNSNPENNEGQNIVKETIENSFSSEEKTIIDNEFKESNNVKTEFLTAPQLENEIKENIKKLLEKIKEKQPEIKDFSLISDKNGFKINSIIKINKTENFFKPTVTINLKIPLEKNKDGELLLGKYTIEAGWATSTVKKQLEPFMPQLISGIKKYFEDKYSKSIDSIKIEDSKLRINFKE